MDLLGMKPFERHMDRTRLQILEAGLKCFITNGSGANMTAIAETAKMSKQRVIYHFASADEILLELCELWGEIGRSVTMEHLAMTTANRPEDKILAISDATFVWMAKYPNWAALTLVLSQAVRKNHKIKTSFRKTLNTGIERIADLLMLSHGGKRDRAKYLIKAQGIHAVIVGTATYVVGQDKWDEIESFKQVARFSIGALLTHEIE